ncbi:unnamed protein product [Moneuplotes crassus]|uniref:Uncharacterized protein n=1 Tax=Euplotes crassus TaxID=5936 RepID=A0AAD1XYT7_EUPCR|nr:unnamed protein product [Moneuplotes crassus]
MEDIKYTKIDASTPSKLDYVDLIHDFMANPKFQETSTVHLEGLKDVITLTLEQKNYGFFFVAQDSHDQIQGVLMASYEFTDWRNGVFFWVQFLEAESEDIFQALLATFKDEADKVEDCKGIRSIYQNKCSDHWEKIDKALELDKSPYCLYHIDVE